VRDQSEFVQRSLRRLGVPALHLDDAAQQVFVVAARRIDDFQEHSERAFLLGVATRVASTERRSARRRPEDATSAFDHCATREPDPEALCELKRARALLDTILGALKEELHSVIVLRELEQRPLRDVASLLGIPLGTVTTRLRAAHRALGAIAKRLAARESSRARFHTLA
jgi:RNA polymerase sigma-70 factor (ECF subfamily)